MVNSRVLTISFNIRPFQHFRFVLCFNSILTPPKVGFLKHSRHGHSAIFDGEKFLVIGGSVSGAQSRTQPIKNPVYKVKNEVCTLKDSAMTCVEQSSVLDSYAYFPGLFLVAKNFGKDISKCWKFCSINSEINQPMLFALKNTSLFSSSQQYTVFTGKRITLHSDMIFSNSIKVVKSIWK